MIISKEEACRHIEARLDNLDEQLQLLDASTGAERSICREIAKGLALPVWSAIGSIRDAINAARKDRSQHLGFRLESYANYSQPCGFITAGATHSPADRERLNAHNESNMKQLRGWYEKLIAASEDLTLEIFWQPSWNSDESAEHSAEHSSKPRNHKHALAPVE